MARRTATAAGVILSHLEFDLLWEDLGPGGPPPYPFDVPSHGATHAERDDLGVRVFADLADAGLTDGDDVDPDLADLIVLDRNPFRIPITEVHETGVTMVLIGGEVVAGD